MTHKVVIIGGGPAGCTAAIYAGRAMLEPLMYEGFMAGGLPAGGQLMTTTHIDNFPGFPDSILGAELMMRMKQQAINSGATVQMKTVDKVDLSARPFKLSVGNDTIEAETLIIATGATAKRLRIPGEDHYWQKGISACAVCDGALPLFRDKPSVVIGGGDVACEEALHMAKYSSKVFMLIRRDVMRASKAMQQKVLDNEKIEVLWHTEALEALGENNLLTQLKVINNQTKEERLLTTAGLFYAIGHTPNTAFLDGQVETDESGYIVVKAGTTQTSVPGVFAAGDVADKKYRQAITSAGTGCMAAMEAEKFTEEG